MHSHNRFFFSNTPSPVIKWEPRQGGCFAFYGLGNRFQDVVVETVRALREERASEIFLDLLRQLLAGGQAVIDDDMRNPREYPSGVTVVGYRDDSFVYLLPEIALKAVNKVQPIHFSATAIGMQLKEDGVLIPGKTNLSTQKSVHGRVIRLWRLKSDAWGCEGCESCDSPSFVQL